MFVKAVLPDLKERHFRQNILSSVIKDTVNVLFTLHLFSFNPFASMFSWIGCIT